MEIQVWTTFSGRWTQDRFYVRTITHDSTHEYSCYCESGGRRWNFRMYSGEKLELESHQLKLPFKERFIYGRREHGIVWQGKEIGVLRKSLMGQEITAGGASYAFPRFIWPDIPGLRLTFSFNAFVTIPIVGELLWNPRVRSYCLEADSDLIGLSIAITIYVWLARNLLPTY